MYRWFQGNHAGWVQLLQMLKEMAVREVDINNNYAPSSISVCQESHSSISTFKIHS